MATRAELVNDGREDLAREHGLAAAARFAQMSAIRGALRDRE
jgi:hypothetical protein